MGEMGGHFVPTCLGTNMQNVYAFSSPNNKIRISFAFLGEEVMQG